jgi:hypothetical protein
MNDSNCEPGPALADTAGQWVKSRSFQAHILEAVQQAVRGSLGPWLNRRAAADFACCSPSEIDRAANAGVFPRYMREGTPLFKREDLTAALVDGRWQTRKGAK